MSHLNVRTGTAYLFVAQIVFFVCAYAMHIFLGRYLGPAEYGLFGVILYASNIINTFIASGFPMAVARYVSAEPNKSEVVYKTGIRLQLFLAIPISVALFVAAPWIAHVLGDDALIPLFRIISPVATLYGIFILIMQYYNGKRLYGLQSLWLTLSYVLRSLCVIGLAIIGYHVFGAVAGLTLAIGISGLLILMTRRPAEKRARFPVSKLLGFSMPLFLSSIGYALLVDLDLMFVKRLVPGPASAGFYTSAKAIAQVPPFAFAALAAALYPAVSNAFSTGNMMGLKDYIWKANRLLLLVILPVFIVVILNSKGFLRLIYGEEYVAAAPALRWLILAFCMLAMFIIHRSIIVGCGFPMLFSVITIVLLPVCIALQLILTPVYGLIGAAFASALTFSIGVISSTIFIYQKFKAGFNMSSTLRIFVGALGVLIVDFVLAKFGVILIPKLLVVGFVYLLSLVLMKELSLEQVRELAGEFISGIQRANNKTDGI